MKDAPEPPNAPQTPDAARGPDRVPSAVPPANDDELRGAPGTEPRLEDGTGATGATGTGPRLQGGSAGEPPVPPPPPDLAPAPLLSAEERDQWTLRLRRAVSGFVDEPQRAVEEADAVLGEASARVAELVKERRRSAPAKGETEELRLALRDCRRLTERMLEL
ncbi:hypothetical protein ACFWXK_09785 [Streptomyces sp. NPDC059070]|uniref:hypothetical protein n=1 Tax=Streptomyces sp. NPDC059070 TaxID=3346713 RepID=UPI0036C5FC69